MKPKILVVGSLVMDLIVTTERFCNAGETVIGNGFATAPRASILAETYVLQCLSVLLQEASNITPEEYVKRHPGGSLGKLREGEY
jgi:arabinose-5-phosphate isomerase